MVEDSDDFVHLTYGFKHVATFNQSTTAAEINSEADRLRTMGNGA